MGITDEKLMAYADGELSEEETAEVDRAIAADSSLAEKVALFIDGRRDVRRAFTPAPAVAPAFEARIRAMLDADTMQPKSVDTHDNVVVLAPRRRVVPLWQLPAAAAIALAIGAGAMLFAMPGGTGSVGLPVAGLGDAMIGDALSTLASGQEKTLRNGDGFKALASFRDGDGRLCREFQHHGQDNAAVLAVACHADKGWTVQFAMVTGQSGTAGYAPASSVETLDAYLSALGAGEPLALADEASALNATR